MSGIASLNRAVLYTDEATHVPEQAGTYWLPDEDRAGGALHAQVAVDPFQLCQLTLGNNAAAMLVREDGNEVHSKDIPFTDLPPLRHRGLLLQWTARLRT